MTKSWLDKNNVTYKTVDLSEDPQALAAVKGLGYMGAPVVIVSRGDTRDESHWYGFRVDLLKEFCVSEGAAA
ncbi:glutaredoxin-like protein NrdH [Zhihengliuella flava]|uniref:Glutaredoxin-like protein NrdH n=2 Tax=Zhihengliuella flava TaxID=1285193 RepID=A0A931GJZ2_9MICC|nr:glutaredoxin-like protein NrdH [Zhihengliuella flava]